VHSSAARLDLSPAKICTLDRIAEFFGDAGDMEKFFAEQAKKSSQVKSDGQTGDGDFAPKKLPKGVVLGKDGKPYASRYIFTETWT
jgi:hypothetical protein